MTLHTTPNSTPQHHNEGLIAYSLDTGVAVREFPGGPGAYARLIAVINSDKYGVIYVGEYLARLNQKISSKGYIA